MPPNWSAEIFSFFKKLINATLDFLLSSLVTCKSLKSVKLTFPFFFFLDTKRQRRDEARNTIWQKYYNCCQCCNTKRACIHDNLSGKQVGSEYWSIKFTGLENRFGDKHWRGKITPVNRNSRFQSIHRIEAPLNRFRVLNCAHLYSGS